MEQTLLEDDAVEQPEVPVTFGVRDAATANWLVRKIVEARAYAARAMAWAEAEARRARHDEDWLLGRYGGQLQEWVRGELAARGGRSRSVKLPAGQVGFRSVPGGVEAVDPAPLAAWCRDHLTGALRLRVDAQGVAAATLLSLIEEHRLVADVTPRVLITEVARHVETLGELPPGADLAPPTERFYVR